jgi:hypothetical protein
MSKSGIPIVSNVGKAVSAIGKGNWSEAGEQLIKAAAPVAGAVIGGPLGGAIGGAIGGGVGGDGVKGIGQGALTGLGLGTAVAGLGASGGLSGIGSSLGLGGASAAGAAGGAGGIGGLGGLGGSLLSPALATGSASAVTPGFLNTLLASPSLATGALSLGSGGLGNVLTGLSGTTALGGSPTTGLLGGLLGGGGTGAGQPSALGSIGQLLGLGGGTSGGGLGGLLGGLSAQDLLIGGGSLASSIYGANVAEKAAKSQREAIDNAIASLREGLATARGDIGTGAQEAAGFLGQQPAEIQAAQQAAAGYLDPFYQAGTAGLGQLQQLAMGQGVPQFLASNPAYQFRQQEAQKALERSAAARGGLLSGQFAKALQERSQGLASEEFGNAFNRLSGVVGMGQQVGQQLSSLRERTGERMLTNIGAQAGLRQQAGTQRAGIGQQFAGSLADLMRSRGDAVATGQIGQANAYNQGLANLTQYVTAPKYRFAGVGA